MVFTVDRILLHAPYTQGTTAVHNSNRTCRSAPQVSPAHAKSSPALFPRSWPSSRRLSLCVWSTARRTRRRVSHVMTDPLSEVRSPDIPATKPLRKLRKTNDAYIVGKLSTVAIFQGRPLEGTARGVSPCWTCGWRSIMAGSHKSAVAVKSDSAPLVRQFW